MVYFFEQVYFVAYKMQNFGSFWPIQAILLQIYALFRVLSASLNNVVVYQNGQISGTLWHTHTHTKQIWRVYQYDTFEEFHLLYDKVFMSDLQNKFN